MDCAQLDPGVEQLRVDGNGFLGGGGKMKKISMENIGVKVLITNRITWNSEQTNKKHLGGHSKANSFASSVHSKTNTHSHASNLKSVEALLGLAKLVVHQS